MHSVTCSTGKQLFFRFQTTLCIVQLLLCHRTSCSCVGCFTSFSKFGSLNYLFRRYSRYMGKVSSSEKNKVFNTRLPSTDGFQEQNIFHVVANSTSSNGIGSNEDIAVVRPRNIRFVSPLLLYGYRPTVEEYENETLFNKPLLLYLPGFDGTYLSPFLQFPELNSLFDVRCMTVGMDDRSTIDEMQFDVLQYIQNECQFIKNSSNLTENIPSVKKPSDEAFAVAKSKNLFTKDRVHTRRSVFIVGESFGALLALLVSIKIQQEDLNSDFVLRGLTLINAATCYDRSRLSVEGPNIAKLNNWFYPFGIVSRLFPLFTDRYSLGQLYLILQGKALPSVIDDPCKEAYMGRVAFSLPKVLAFMPKETLQWRLTHWLEIGCRLVSAATTSNQKTIFNIKNVRTLVIAGENDVALPSIAEAERLTCTIPNSVVHVVDGAGHASTCGSRIDLAALFRCYFSNELCLSNNKDSLSVFSWQLFFPWLTDFNSSSVSYKNRNSMKEVASKGIGSYFGMQPRYDNASLGLNPFLYWDEKYYQKVKNITQY